MRIHRSAHARAFAVLPNALLQDRRLSYTARGLLADLLSRPDGRREDGRQMADSSTQGRGAVRRALRELTEAGYYRVNKIRMPNGRVHSEAHVFDTPQPTSPGTPRPAAGEATAGPAGTPSVKNPEKTPSRGGRHADEPSARPARRPKKPPAAEPDEQTREAVATLFRVIRPEPRLRLGEAEALGLAPLVTRWLERGCTTAELARALLPDLPAPLHSPAALLRYRLERTMPPVRPAGQPPGPRYGECTRCHDPVSQPGICRACAGLAPRPVAVGGGALATRSGVALAREAMRTAGQRIPRPRRSAPQAVP
ncbi:helix-turn-helix domain-containing protein [Kitasatospora sp. CMC57]|uniref:Helix-turn-helix domain-containing protein n=1 Tax=Kitasatospora sp. CMC57 TaxID=3231513 RepID=A0AB33JVY9_9ACTN